MNCKHAKSQIALLIGGDLDGPAEAALRLHLNGCNTCCQHHRSMHRTLRVLQECEQLPSEREIGSSQGSLWPHLQARLAVDDGGRGRSRFNGWPPAVAVAAACLVIALTVGNRIPERPKPSDNGFGILAEIEQAGMRNTNTSDATTGHLGDGMFQSRSRPSGDVRLESRPVLHPWPPRVAEPSYWPPSNGQRLWYHSLPR